VRHWQIIFRYHTRAGLVTPGLALLVAVLLVTVASAHGAELLGADPAPGSALDTPPDQVRTWFGGELNVDKSLLQVFDGDGRQVDNGDGGVDRNDSDHASMVVSLPALADGAYTVRWYAVLEDGDPTEGLFHFTVGDVAVAPGEIVLPAPLSADDDGGRPIALIAVVVAVLVAGALGVGVRLRSTAKK
jgi:copper transport protein